MNALTAEERTLLIALMKRLDSEALLKIAGAFTVAAIRK